MVPGYHPLMIASLEEYQRTKEYTDRLQQILLGLRATHSAPEYETMSKAYLKELTKAQREIAIFLAVPLHQTKSRPCKYGRGGFFLSELRPGRGQRRCGQSFGAY